MSVVTEAIERELARLRMLLDSSADALQAAEEQAALAAEALNAARQEVGQVRRQVRGAEAQIAALSKELHRP